MVSALLAKLSALAIVTHTEPAELLGELKKHGIEASSQQSIHDLATQHGVDENELLAIVFLSR